MTDINETKIDFSKYQKDYAQFVPAISEMYARYINNPNPKRVPHFGRKWLDFLQPDTGLFYIPSALYSAGQAAGSARSLTEEGASKDSVMSRDPQYSTLIGDSGGFQVETGVLKWKGDETREQILRWLELYCDYSMVLDFPTGSIERRGEDFARQYNIKWGEEFKFCLERTMENNDYFVKHRQPGATKFLNVIQGRTLEETDEWYEAVKDYPFEGWALAGKHKEDFELTVRRLLKMRDDGKLDDRDWIHFLGMGRVKNGCVYSTLQRELRKQVNPNLTISYDVSSPFSSAAYGLMFFDYTMSANKWGITSRKGPDDVAYVGSETTLAEWLEEQNEKLRKNKDSELVMDLFDTDATAELHLQSMSPIAKQLTLGDLCVNSNVSDKKHKKEERNEILEQLMADEYEGTDLATDEKEQGNPNEKLYTSTWDVCSYALAMNHNTYVQLAAILEGQRLYDTNQRNFVPAELLEIKEVIQEAFQREDWEDYLSKNTKILNKLSSTKAGRGVSVIENDQLFGVERG